ncbi:MAG: DUF1015 domain-containing protein [Bacteroidales bacterium]|nr:DUF1015 domain-containing protein [Bacteroidales bacterium]
MAVVKPFRGFRPKKELVHLIACRPYDVLNSDEALEEAKDNPLSFLHVTKSEIDLSPGIDVHSDPVYQKARSNLENLIQTGIFIQDPDPCYYIYAQTFRDKTQYGIVGCASVDDYLNDVIKKHELTRPDKEEDRKNHIRVTNFNAEPVFFVFPDNPELDAIISQAISSNPVYNFRAVDDVIHQLWVIDDQNLVNRIEVIFKNNVPCTYVADGHHRTAAAAHVGEERKKMNRTHQGNEEYNYFLAVHFQASQLTIIDYNRVVKDLNGNTAAEFVRKLESSFEVKKIGKNEYKPQKLHEFSMYTGGDWYFLTTRKNIYNDDDPIDCLDVTILYNHVLLPILNITDLRKSTRIDFVGGIRGLGELTKRVDSGEMAAAFALYPVSMEQLIRIADTGNIMPPKTTWFEPKLRSGLVLHCLD